MALSWRHRHKYTHSVLHGSPCAYVSNWLRSSCVPLTWAHRNAIHRLNAVCFGFSERPWCKNRGTSMSSIPSAMVGKQTNEATRCFNSEYEHLLEPEAYRLNRQVRVFYSSQESRSPRASNERTNTRSNQPPHEPTTRTSERTRLITKRTNQRTDEFSEFIPHLISWISHKLNPPENVVDLKELIVLLM